MDKVFIKNLRVRAILGILEREREIPQDVIINVTVFTGCRPANAPDDITVCVDYAMLAENIRALVESARMFTVEALAEEIARLCLSQSLVRKVVVQVEKPEAIAGAESAGVEIERGRV